MSTTALQRIPTAADVTHHLGRPLASGALGVSAAVPAIYAALDSPVTGTQAAAKAALDRVGLVNEIVVEPNADHAFLQ